MASKKTFENIAKNLPSFFKNASDFIKKNFDENGKRILENYTGTAGVIVGLFAQPIIDRYFENLEERKLEDFGFYTYLKSALIQATISLDEIREKIDNSLDPLMVFGILKTTIENAASGFDTNYILLIYQPKYHPAIAFVRDSYLQVLRELNVGTGDIKVFLKNFNDNIELTVAKEFGESYDQHLKQTEAFRLKDNETKFLWDTIRQGKIGFKETENLKYEATFGHWKKISYLRDKDEYNLEKLEDHANLSKEQLLVPVEELIDEYFNQTSDNHLESILFIIADFGKGKSVFMKHFAAELAKQYFQTSNGYFPIYFNLRNFKHYSSEPKLGVISDYLETRYSIKIDDDYFQKKKYIFLIDSLDESGELSKHAIDKVIASIKNIQGINKAIYKTNRIIITSRPFDEGLSHHLNEHNPFTLKNDENRDISFFINIYGFTKIQFNDWLIETLKGFSGLEKIKVKGFAKSIVEAIINKKNINIYDELLINETLSESELRRPIFAYMIYQLIINDVDFLSVGKLGVYLSFLNLLTKEAKHIHDINYKVNLKEEFEFRNVLQATASLWMYERQRGKQGMLTKADICRVLEGKASIETDIDVIERFKGQGFTEIQFLSHSYFGENDNVLHFQHQSFAEILLAEYYLKIFIKYALDEDADYEEARVKLTLGEPTEQTILFLKEILKLLRETSTHENTKEIIEKRKLLFPLMASLATNKFNRLFCNDIYYSWYKQCKIGENQTEYPITSLENWCIDKIKLNKILTLAANILNSKTTYLPTQANSKNALFNDEVLEFKNQDAGRLTPNIDRWLALLVGNHLYNEMTHLVSPDLFNHKFDINFAHLFEMLKSWNHTFNESAPAWGKDLFMGINMENNNQLINLNYCNFDGINFSYSYLKNFRCWSSNWSRSFLDNCSFESTNFVTSLFFSTSIQNIISLKDFYMSNCECSNGLKILDSFLVDNNLHFFTSRENFQRRKIGPTLFSVDIDEGEDMLVTCSGFMAYGLKRSYFTVNDIKKWFIFEDKDIEKKFLKKVNALKKYESQTSKIKSNIETSHQ